jgi:hypothetical protein
MHIIDLKAFIKKLIIQDEFQKMNISELEKNAFYQLLK